MIDLHSHTTASDGQHAPSVLLQMAREAGVTHLAVTDHDTVAGLAEARATAQSLGIELVHGIELSAFVNRKEVHILGHFISPEDTQLAGLSALLRTERRTRMEQMVEKMRGLGFPVSMEDVLVIAQDAQLGRPHLARVLVEKGFCLSTKEAFDRFLGDGKPAWVDRYRLLGNEAVKLIRDAGGAATLAHPFVSKVTELDVRELKDAGLAGLEVFHSDHPPAVREKMLELSRKLDLVATAGSDFHGEAVAPGRRLGTASMDARAFDTLRSRASQAL
jgi:3',5'-nucleoside bisphosphate phosphatase